MAINLSPGAPLRHINSFVSSGVWNAPAGVTLAFVSIHGASGGGGGRGGSGRYSGGSGGNSPVAAGWVQVNPGNPHTVVIGAGGSMGNDGVNGNGGTSAGTTSFDGAIIITGGNGGNGASRYGTGNSGNSGSASGVTSLTTLSPSNAAIVRVNGYVSQNTGATAGGNTGANGTNGVVHIYV